MTEPQPPPAPEEGEPTTTAGRLRLRQRAGGVLPPILTAIFAFFMGGLVIAASGHNPLDAYLGILDGAGLNWFWDDFGNTDVLELTTFNFTQTLLRTTTFIFTGLAVAFAFRCGLFNIGGQGQYTIGIVVAVWVGAYWGNSLPNGLHVVVGIVLAALAGAIWAGIAGILKATVGAHEVITTIMLNWIALWFASYCFGQGGPLQNRTPGQESVPSSDDVSETSGAIIPILWGDEGLQALHYGFFLAIAALVVFWVVLNRTTLGYEVRAVGFNPEAAAYGGISVKKNFFLAMAISGSFAGLAAGTDIFGWKYDAGVLDVQASAVGFVGIAVALLGRSTAVGVGLGALIFGALDYGTTRGLDPEVFDPTLAGNLSLMIQGLVVLFVGADLLILYLWSLRRKRFVSPRMSGRGA
ncbi:MAG: transporter permease [Thermoleophilia bacterium]|nr:transporter permease [Thermoleophilia bacterium]